MRQGLAIFAAAAIVAASLPLLREHDDVLAELLSKAKLAVTGDKSKSNKTIDPPPLAGIELQYLDDRRDVVVAPGHGKRNAELTLDPIYQRAALTFLRQGQVYEGSVVMTDVRTGRVLVWASHNSGRPRDLAVEATAPAASIFKIVTGSALVEAGVPLNEKFCHSGDGEHGIQQRHIESDQDGEKYCDSLGMAMGRSINPIFGRLAVKHLTPTKLEGAARRLGWGLDIPFDVPVAPSTIEMPADDELEYARAAAGFWHTTMSPFQGANLAQTIANGGMMIRSFIVARVVDEEGQTIYQRPQERPELKRVLDERTAWAVARMMEQTVRNGSSFRSFHDSAGRPFFPDLNVAGKTGTLALKQKSGETLFTWWVGFAPAKNPEVAISVLIANRGAWRIKGTHVAADMLRIFFADRGRAGVEYPSNYQGVKRGPEPSKNKRDKAPADKGEPVSDPAVEVEQKSS
jgi:cell division protein FtsI/penicillin-binding protein 2